MAQYELVINIVGKDSASNAFRGARSALDSIAQTALGIVSARILFSVADGVVAIGAAALNAAGQYQLFAVSLSSLAARELVNLSDGMKTVAQVFPEATKMSKQWLDQLSRVAILSPYTLEATQYTFRMAMAFGFTGKEAMSFTNGILNMASGIGANNDMLQRMAYNLAQVRLQGKVTALDVRQLALAGFDLTGVLKSVSKQFGYNINDYLDFNKLIAEGKISWADFASSFEKYANQMFGGSAERMSRTLLGLQSTFHDVFVLTIPKLVGPALEIVTGMLSRFLNIFLAFRESGVLEKWGASFETAVKKFLGPLDSAVGFIETFVTAFMDLKNAQASGAPTEVINSLSETLSAFGGPSEVFRKAITLAFGADFLAKMDSFFKTISDLKGTVDKVVNFFSQFGTDMTTVGENLKTFWVQNGPKITQILGEFLGKLGDIGKGKAKQGLTDIGGALIGLSEWLISQGPTIVENLSKITTWITDTAIPAIREFGPWLTGTLIPQLKELGDKLIALAPTVLVIAGVFVTISTIMSTLQTLAPVLGLIMEFFITSSATAGGAAGMLGVLGTAAVTAIGAILPLAAVIAGVAIIAAAVVTAFITNFMGFRDAVIGVWNAIVAALAPVFAQLVVALGPLWVQLQQLGIVLQPLGTFLLQILETIGVVLLGVLTVAIGLLTGLIGGLVGAITGAAQMITGVIQGIVTLFQGIGAAFQGVFDMITGLFTNNSALMTAGMQELQVGLVTIWTGLWQVITSILQGSIDILIGFFTGFVSSVITYGASILQQLGIITAGVAAQLVTLAAKFIEVGQGIVSGIRKGINDAWSSFVSWVFGLVASLVAGIKDSLGIKSPSKVFQGIGKNMILGLIKGFEDFSLKPQLTLNAMVPGINNQPSTTQPTVQPVQVQIINQIGDRLDLETVMDSFEARWLEATAR